MVVSPVGATIGLSTLPPVFFARLLLMIVTYPRIVQLFKRRFYETSGWRA